MARDEIWRDYLHIRADDPPIKHINPWSPEGADFMHLLEPERRQWIIERIENIHTDVDQNRIL